MGKRGRPKGHKLSAESKKKISRSKMGHAHSTITKEKIAKSVEDYWLSIEGIERKEVLSRVMDKFWASTEGQVIKRVMSVKIREALAEEEANA